MCSGYIISIIVFSIIIILVNNEIRSYKKIHQYEKFNNNSSYFKERCNPNREYCVSHVAGPLRIEERQRLANACSNKNTKLYPMPELKPSFAGMKNPNCYTNVFNESI